MNSILRQINQNIGRKSHKELMDHYMYLIDEELNKMYSKTDCVQNYGNYFQKSKVNCRQIYHCSHNLCHFSTNKSSLIVRHIRRHLKQKPYLCPIEGCKQRFYQRCDLRCHLLRHFEDKPFKCHHLNCSKTYTTRKALSLHIKSHLPFGFNCNDCHKKFTTNWKLKKHTKALHNSDNPSPQLVSQTLTNCETKTESIAEPEIKTEVQSKAFAKDLSHVTNKLIDSVNDINDQMKEELLSNDRLKSFSAQFGFEEVMQYVIHNCGQPSNNREEEIVIKEPIQPKSDEVSDRMSPIDSNPEPNKYDSNHLLMKCVENVCSLIETYTLGSIHTNKKYLFKCIHCVFASDTIQSIVGHVWDHISDGVTQCMRKQLP